jgi:hypothetical protein
MDPFFHCWFLRHTALNTLNWLQIFSLIGTNYSQNVRHAGTKLDQWLCPKNPQINSNLNNLMSYLKKRKLINYVFFKPTTILFIRKRHSNILSDQVNTILPNRKRFRNVIRSNIVVTFILKNK